MNKAKQDSRVVPFTGYLHPEPPPAPTPQKQTPTPYITIAALVFVGGLAIGAISAHQSIDYTTVEQLRAQAKQLSNVKKTVCGL